MGSSNPPRPSIPSSTQAEVSGRAFLGLIRHVKDAHGEAALREVVELTGEGARNVFVRRIGINDWHPYHVYVRFLRALERRLGSGDRTYARRLGEVAGTRDLGTIFKVFVAIASPERLIRACDRIWPSYYRNAGSMSAIDWRPESTIVKITGFPAMDPLHCRLMEGWMIATMATIGCKVDDNARESECPSRGGLHHQFTCTWTKS